MAYQEVWKKSGLHRVFTDTTSCEEILNANMKLYANPTFNDIQFVINDFSRVLQFEIPPQSMNEYVATEKEASKNNKNLKVAMLVTNEYISTFARIYALRMEEVSFKCELFETINDANSWIHGSDFIPELDCPIVTSSQEINIPLR